jgi:hypothetical protein
MTPPKDTLTASEIAGLVELEAKATQGRWFWGTTEAGPEDDNGCSTFGPIDVLAFKSTGYCGNPILVTDAIPADDFHVVSGGGGEYTPYGNPHDAVLIPALRNAAPALLSMAARCVEQAKEIEALRAKVTELGGTCEGWYRISSKVRDERDKAESERDALKAEVERLLQAIEKVAADALNLAGEVGAASTRANRLEAKLSASEREAERLRGALEDEACSARRLGQLGIEQRLRAALRGEEAPRGE